PDGKMERREVEENGTAIAYFLPETLHIAGDVETQMLHRGIYDAAVFRAQVTLSGKFSAPDFGPTQDRRKGPAMEGCVCHYRGERFARNTRGNDARLGRHQAPVAAGVAGSRIHNGGDRVAGYRSTDSSETEFSIPLDFNGSEGIYFAPFGVQNEATLKSNWPDPAFRGA